MVTGVDGVSGSERPRQVWALALGPLLPAIGWFLARPDSIVAIGRHGGWLEVTGPRLSGLAAFGATFILLGVIPIALTPWVHGRSPREIGLGLGDGRRGLALLALGIPVAAVVGILSARDPSLAVIYPLGAPGLAAVSFGPHLLGYLLYYTGFEYHFRGFLLLGLEGRLGSWGANFLQAGIATLAHLGKPPIELLAVYPASLLFGWVALRTRSIWYAVAIHWVVGVTLDYFLLVQ
jgi:uncharacterized protein